MTKLTDAEDFAFLTPEQVDAEIEQGRRDAGLPTEAELALALAAEDAGVLADLCVRMIPDDATAEQAAKALYKLLCAASKAGGQDPKTEVMIRAPGEPRHYNDTTCWCVAWEAGPYDWAVPASMAITCRKHKLVEPYYGFDLCLYPAEWN